MSTRKPHGALIAVAILVPVAAEAHPGATDAHGCHTDRSTGGYHCHGGKHVKRGKRRSRVDLQKYEAGFDPDRIAAAFAGDVPDLGDRAVQSNFAPLFSASEAAPVPPKPADGGQVVEHPPAPTNRRTQGDPEWIDPFAVPRAQPRAPMPSTTGTAATGAGRPPAAPAEEEADAATREERSVDPSPPLPYQLQRQDVLPGFRAATAEVRSCAAQYRLSRAVLVEVLIEPNGTVSSVEPVAEQLKDTEAGGCIRQVMQQTRFPRFRGPAMRITYGFALQ